MKRKKRKNSKFYNWSQLLMTALWWIWEPPSQQSTNCLWAKADQGGQAGSIWDIQPCADIQRDQRQTARHFGHHSVAFRWLLLQPDYKTLMHSYKIYQIKHTPILNHFSTAQNSFISHIYFCNIQLSTQELHFSVRSVSNKLILLTYRFKYCSSFKNQTRFLNRLQVF